MQAQSIRPVMVIIIENAGSNPVLLTIKQKKMERLISMTDFVLMYIDLQHAAYYRYYTGNYAKFLSQPLTLSMFVPCDEEGNVLSEPDYSTLKELYSEEYTLKANQYNAAKEKVLFEGFKICNLIESVKCVVNEGFHFSYDYAIKNGERIEDLVKYGLILTTTAKKQIFG